MRQRELRYGLFFVLAALVGTFWFLSQKLQQESGTIVLTRLQKTHIHIHNQNQTHTNNERDNDPSLSSNSNQNRNILKLDVFLDNSTTTPIPNSPLCPMIYKVGDNITCGPRFVGFGNQKCGTTTIWHWLEKHPQMVVPRMKEFHYFDGPSRIPGEYLDAFPIIAPNSNTITGEWTPRYSMTVNAAPELKKQFPHLKLAFAIRDPTFRDISGYFYHILQLPEEIQKGKVSGFASLFNKHINIITKSEVYQNPQSNWSEFINTGIVHPNLAVGRGFYSKILKYWLQYFDKSQIFIFTLEQLKDPMTAVSLMHNFTEFLGIERFDWKPIVEKVENSNDFDYRPYLHPMIIAKLKTMYEPFNKELMEMYPELSHIIEKWNGSMK